MNVSSVGGSNFHDILHGNDDGNSLKAVGPDTGVIGEGGDQLYGHGGEDNLRSGTGDDYLDGGAGYDTASFDIHDDYNPVHVSLAITGPQDTGQGVDTLVDIENLSGTRFGDALTGNDQDNWLWGEDGDDALKGGGGNDWLDGGAGNDTALYSDKSAAVVVTLNGAAAATVTVGGIAEDTIQNIENVTGGSGNDTLTGNGLANTLDGGAGADTHDRRARQRHLRRRRRGDVVTEAAGGGTDTCRVRSPTRSAPTSRT